MVTENTATDIEVVHEGEAREIALRSTGPDSECYSANFIRVGKFRDGHIRVVGYALGSQAYRQDVIGTSVWEPRTRNTIGGLGASRDLPPTQQQVGAAIDQARAAIVNLAGTN